MQDDLPQQDTPSEYGTRHYQDDFDSGNDATDPIIDEQTDDPAELLVMDSDEFKRELDRLDTVEDADDEMGEDRSL